MHPRNGQATKTRAASAARPVGRGCRAAHPDCEQQKHRAYSAHQPLQATRKGNETRPSASMQGHTQEEVPYCT
eukprot:14890569-Alexandrium_andersonii.AAC.1